MVWRAVCAETGTETVLCRIRAMLAQAISCVANLKLCRVNSTSTISIHINLAATERERERGGGGGERVTVNIHNNQ